MVIMPTTIVCDCLPSLQIAKAFPGQKPAAQQGSGGPGPAPHLGRGGRLGRYVAPGLTGGTHPESLQRKCKRRRPSQISTNDTRKYEMGRKGNAPLTSIMKNGRISLAFLVYFQIQNKIQLLGIRGFLLKLSKEKFRAKEFGGFLFLKKNYS